MALEELPALEIMSVHMNLEMTMSNNIYILDQALYHQQK